MIHHGSQAKIDGYLGRLFFDMGGQNGSYFRIMMLPHPKRHVFFSDYTMGLDGLGTGRM